MRRKRSPADHSVSPDATLRDTAAVIGRGRIGFVLVLDDEGRLVDTLTDGDLRRAVLAGHALDEPVSAIASRRAGTVYAHPVSASEGLPVSELVAVMARNLVRHLPLTDASGRIVDLFIRDDLAPIEELPIDAVVMAGGFGHRLGRLTQDVPKPMLPLGEKPLLEHTVRSLKEAGIRRVHLTTHYLGEVIKAHFQDGKELGVDISYVDETQPLGTAGALGLLPTTQGPVLVMNGDIVTNVDFRSMLEFHQEHQASLTVGVRQYEVQVPYGVVESEGAQVRAFREKPTATFLVNAGLYLIDSAVLGRVPANQRLDMSDLIQDLLLRGESVVSFPVLEYWLDIGQLSDYARAQEDWGPGASPLP